jgi:hypothetical protein
MEIVQFEGYVQDEFPGSTLSPAGRTCPHRTPPSLTAMSGWSLTGATRCRLTASGAHSISALAFALNSCGSILVTTGRALRDLAGR